VEMKKLLREENQVKKIVTKNNDIIDAMKELQGKLKGEEDKKKDDSKRKEIK
jgi:hypothetical protein